MYSVGKKIDASKYVYELKHLSADAKQTKDCNTSPQIPACILHSIVLK